MRPIRFALAVAAMALAVQGTYAQQIPTGGNGLTFVPVDTRNSVAPIPVMGTQPKGSYFSRFFDSLKSLVGVSPSRRASLPGPRLPGTKLPPASAQNTGPKPIPSGQFPELPKLPPIVSGVAR